MALHIGQSHDAPAVYGIIEAYVSIYSGVLKHLCSRSVLPLSSLLVMWHNIEWRIVASGVDWSFLPKLTRLPCQGNLMIFIIKFPKPLDKFSLAYIIVYRICESPQGRGTRDPNVLNVFAGEAEDDDEKGAAHTQIEGVLTKAGLMQESKKVLLQSDGSCVADGCRWQGIWEHRFCFFAF